MMVDFQEDNFEQKLLGLKDTQDSIQSLSVWCLKHQSHHKKIVNCWLHVLKKVKVEQRVTLFYLANDVIQHSKRKNYPFVESWATALQRATPLVREEKVKNKILRLFKIWDERSVYDEAFLSDLSGLITAQTKKSSSQQSTADLIQEFQPTLLFTKIRQCKVLEEDTDLKLKIVKQSSIPISDIDALQVVVKDRRNGDDLLQDLDDGIVKLEAYTKALESEIRERTEVINVLEVSEHFYETQRGEAKVVCNAYKNFGNRIKTLKRKLEEFLPRCPSPVPSPDVDAPSPSSGSDIDIPDDENKSGAYDSEKSFIGTDFATAMNNGPSEKQIHYMKSLEQQGYNYNPANEQAQYNPYYDSYQQSKLDTSESSSLHGYYSNISRDGDSPTSPTEKLHNSDHYAFRSDNTPLMEEGKPIEVISSSDNHKFNVGQFLQNIMSTSAPPPTIPSLSSSSSSAAAAAAASQSKIPGLESPTSTNSRDVFNFIESKMKAGDESLQLPWEEKPLTKYQSWPSPEISWNHSQETPVSPPAFERESYDNPVEYVDTSMENNRFGGMVSFPPPNVGAALPPPPPTLLQRPMDVDHRLMNCSKPPPNLVPPPQQQQQQHHDFRLQISAIPLPKHDVDDRLLPPNNSMMANRNLISLTESPSSHHNESGGPWKGDSDYRTIPMPPTPPVVPMTEGTRKTPQDQIESVDMEMSDDELADNDHDKQDSSGMHTRHRRTSQTSAAAAAASAAIASAHKDEDERRKLAEQLLPPPNPWDMLNIPMDSDESGSGKMNELMSNLESPDEVRRLEFGAPPPFNHPPEVPPPFGHPPPPLMRLSTPDGPPPSVFHPRHRDFPPPMRGMPPPPNNFRNPFGNFLPMYPPNAQSNFSQTPRKEFFGDKRPPPMGAPNVNTIEPLIKSRKFDNNSSPPPVKTVPMHTNFKNLKEISLSDMLEKTMTEADNARREQEAKAAAAAAAVAATATAERDAEDEEEIGGNDGLDLFGEDVGNDVSGGDDGGDDLYNNIEEHEAEGDCNKGSEEKATITAQQPSEVKVIMTSNFVVYESEEGLQNSVLATGNISDESSPSKPKMPFQGMVPRVARPLLAPPPNPLDENEERIPWPLLPVIDLSNENSSPSGLGGSGGGGEFDNSIDMNNVYNPEKVFGTMFTTPPPQMNGTPTHAYRGRFPNRGGAAMNPHAFLNSGGGRFPNAVTSQSPRMTDMGRPRRFSTPRQEYRPRGGANMTPGMEFRTPQPRALGNQMQPTQEYRPRISMPNQDFRQIGGSPEFRPRGDDQIRRMQRPQQFGGNVRGNFQSTPRMFKGGGRPFRRGW